MLTTIYLLKVHTACLQAPSPKKPQPEQAPNMEAQLREEECAIFPSVEDAPLQILVCCMQKSGNLSPNNPLPSAES